MVRTSAYADEHRSSEEGLDLGVAFKRIAENVLSRPVRVVAHSDHLGMMQSIRSAAPSLKAKSWAVSLYSIKESMASNELGDVGIFRAISARLIVRPSQNVRMTSSRWTWSRHCESWVKTPFGRNTDVRKRGKYLFAKSGAL